MSEKLLIERLKSLSAEASGPIREALLDAAMALTEAERDAARYRWLREHTVATGLTPLVGSHQFLDTAIDAAMRATDSASVRPRYKPNEHAQRCDNCGKTWIEHKLPDEYCSQ